MTEQPDRRNPMNDPGVRYAFESMAASVSALGTRFDQHTQTVDRKFERLGEGVSHLDEKVDHYMSSTVSKSEFEAYKRLGRQITMWGIALVCSVGVGVVTIITTR